MIWKALSDPTRRSILSALRNAPQTTGQLSASFKNLSRYAIMKHLGILEKANLITVKREGKFRWNHLNTMPIQQTYEQWVSNILQLKYLTTQTPDNMEESSKTITTTTVFIELKINASNTETTTNTSELVKLVAELKQTSSNHSAQQQGFAARVSLSRQSKLLQSSSSCSESSSRLSKMLL